VSQRIPRAMARSLLRPPCATSATISPSGADTGSSRGSPPGALQPVRPRQSYAAGSVEASACRPQTASIAVASQLSRALPRPRNEIHETIWLEMCCGRSYLGVERQRPSLGDADHFGVDVGFPALRAAASPFSIYHAVKRRCGEHAAIQPAVLGSRLIAPAPCRLASGSDCSVAGQYRGDGSTSRGGEASPIALGVSPRTPRRSALRYSPIPR